MAGGIVKPTSHVKNQNQMLQHSDIHKQTHTHTHLTRAAAVPGLDMMCRDTVTWNGFVEGRGSSEDVRRDRVRGVAEADGAGPPSSSDTRAGDAPLQVRYRLRP